MTMTAHPERKLEVDRYKSSVKVVAEEGLEPPDQRIMTPF
jgi:hypothetical protein